MLEKYEPYSFEQITCDKIATSVAGNKLDGSYERLNMNRMAQTVGASKVRAARGLVDYFYEQFEEAAVAVGAAAKENFNFVTPLTQATYKVQTPRCKRDLLPISQVPYH